jgi:Kef-type K+ transport system membrane component KefB
MQDFIGTLIQQPWSLAPDTFLGATLVALIAAFAGEGVWRFARWPRLVGYGLVGTVLAVVGLGVDGRHEMIRLAVDAALAVLLFECGARVNLRWLRHNPWLLASSLCEAALAAVVVYVVATSLGVAHATALPLAIILMASAPALVLRVVGELDAAGQVTDRVVTMSALNALYAVLALQLFGAGMLLDDPATWQAAIGPVAFSFFGSIVLAALIGTGIGYVARHLDLRHDHAVLMMVGCVMLALVLAKTLHLSTLLVPLLAGLWLRNRSERPWVWPRHFGSLGALLVLALFVIVNASWRLDALAPWLLVALAVLLARWAAKTLAVMVLARPSGLSMKQSVWLGAALTPVSATAWVMALDHAALRPGSGVELVAVMLTCVALLELVSPLIVTASLRAVGEVDRHAGATRRAIVETVPTTPSVTPSSVSATNAVTTAASANNASANNGSSNNAPANTKTSVSPSPGGSNALKGAA